MTTNPVTPPPPRPNTNPVTTDSGQSIFSARNIIIGVLIIIVIIAVSNIKFN